MSENLQVLNDLLNFQFESGLNGWVLWATLAGLGLFVGIITGLFGVGGGFLVTPMLNIIVGIPYDVAVGSDLCFIVGTSAGGLGRHWGLGNLDIRAVLLIACGSMTGTLLGDMLQGFIIHTVAGGDPLVFTEIMHVFFLIILLLAAWLVWTRRSRQRQAKSLLQRFPLGPFVNLPVCRRDGVSLPGLLGLGVGVGVLVGLLGVGGGVLLVPILLLVVGLDAHHAVGTSLGVVFLSAIVGTVVKGLNDQVSLAVAAALLVTSTTGVQIGVWLCVKLSAERLQKYFAIIVLLAAVVVGADLINKLCQ